MVKQVWESPIDKCKRLNPGIQLVRIPVVLVTLQSVLYDPIWSEKTLPDIIYLDISNCLREYCGIEDVDYVWKTNIHKVVRGYHLTQYQDREFVVTLFQSYRDIFNHVQTYMYQETGHRLQYVKTRI